MFHRILNSLILLPDRACYQVPADLGLQAQAVTFPNAQGQVLHGLWVQPQPTARTAATRDAPVVLFCPGTSGNLSSHLYYIEALSRAGCAVLGFDYTGFGASHGRASLHTLLADVLCAGEWMTHTIGTKRWGIFGISLGANLALAAATQRPDIAAVAVEGLADYEEIVRGILHHGVMGPRTVTALFYDGKLQPPRAYHVVNSWTVPPWLAQHLAHLGVGVFPFPGKMPQALAQALTDTPILFIHGIDDPLLPFEGTLQSYDATPAPKRLWLIPHVGHAQEPILARDGEYVAQLHDFFCSALEPCRPGAWPSLSCHILPRHPAMIQLTNPGPACLTLLTTGDAMRVASTTLWMRAQEQRQWPLPMTAPQWASVLRLFATTGCEATAREQLTPRGQQYQSVFRPLIRELARLLHEGKLDELPAVLHALPQERPAAPFDFFLGVYCVQIMQRTQRRQPLLARTAADIFCRYWHYGPSRMMPGQPSLWTLASSILGRSVSPGEIS